MVIKVEELFRLWAKECRDEVSDGWKLTQDQLINDFINPIIGHIPVKNLKPIDTIRVLNAMKDNDYSTQSRLHVYNVMHLALDSAVSVYELIKSNPLPEQYRPKVVHRELKFLQVEHSFLLLAKSIGHRYQLAVFINLLSALRVGEIQALTWDCVDFENKELVIKNHYCRKTKKIIPRTKNGESYRSPIPPLLFDILKKHRKRMGFVANFNGKMMNHMSYHKALKKLCREADIPEVSSHGLRHSATEIWYEKGATLEDLRRLLNHKTDKSTHRYIHKSNRRLKEIASLINFKIAV